MSPWVSASDLAGLPGLPSSRRRITDRAKRDGWRSRARAGRGGGLEYHIDSLPVEARSALLAELAVGAEAGGRDASAAAAGAGGAVPAPPAGSAETASRDGVSETASRDGISETASRDGISETASRNGISPAAHLIDRAAAADDRRRRRAEAAAKFSRLAADSPKRERAKAREWLILAAAQLKREHGYTDAAARDALAHAVNMAEHPVPSWVARHLPRRDHVRRLTADSLYRWARCYEDGGLWALTDAYGNRAGANRIETDPALYRLLLGQLLHTPQATAKDLHAYARACGADLAAAGADLPSLRTVQRWRTGWVAGNRQLWTYITAPGRWKNHFQVAFGSHQERILRLNQLWELDSTPGDWLLKDGRHSVVGCIDLYSRRLALYVSKTSTAHAVGQVFRRAALDWGMPEAVRTDNGKDYVSDYFSSVLRELEIPQELCIPFASEQKGTVERALKTMAYGIAKLLPGYIGHSVAERKEIEDRKSFAARIMDPHAVVEVDMSAADLQRALDDWLASVYHQDAHAGEGMAGLTPMQKAAHYAGPVRHVDPRALDALLMPVAGERTVSKKGIRWDHRLYIAPELAAWVGEPVRCRFDEQDLGRLYVYTDDAFVCVAECPEMTGISKAEVAAAAHARQRRHMADTSAELKRLKRETHRNAAEEVLRHRAEQDGKLVQFPGSRQPRQIHETPALQAGAAAARAAEPRAPRQDTAADLAAKQALAQEMAQVRARVLQIPETSADRYRRWLRIDRAVKRGEGWDNADELRWWETYAKTPEWRSEHGLAEDFPEAYRVE